MFKESISNVEGDKEKILNNVYDNRNLQLVLKTTSIVRISFDNRYYKLNNNFQNKLNAVNYEIKSYFNVGQIKSLMIKKGFKKDEISIKDDEGNEYEDNIIPNCAYIDVQYKDDIKNYLESKTVKIEFLAVSGLVLDREKDYVIDFFKDNITKDTKILKFITDKFKKLLDKNCKIKYFNFNEKKIYDVNENDKFEDGDIIIITINEEISGFTKKYIEKNKINIIFEVNDTSKYVFTSDMNNISSLEIEKGKTYKDLITEINKHLKKEIKTGFKIYKNNKKTEFKSGKIENGVTYIVVFDKEATDFVKEKEKDKLYINIKFEVKDSENYVLNSILDINNLGIEKGKAYGDLITEINKHLKKEIKTGFKIYKNAKDSEFTVGNLEDGVTYIVVFDETATDFVKEKENDKLYINLKFEVTDNTKFKLRQDVTDNTTGIKVDKGKDYNELLNIIKQHLGGRDLKKGFKIYKNNKNTEFNSGEIENGVTYIVVFDETATDFVEQKKEDKKDEEQNIDENKTNTGKNTSNEDNTNEENIKKGKKYCNSNRKCSKK